MALLAFLCLSIASGNMVPQDAHADFGTFVRSRLGITAQTSKRSRGYLAPRPLVLHAMVSSAGHELITEPAYDWHGRKRGSAEFVLWQLTIAGRGQLTHHGEHYVLTPGRLMLLHFPDDNRYWLAPGDTWEHCYLCLHGREVIRAWRTVSEQLGPVLPVAAGEAVLERGLDLCATTLHDGFAEPFAASAASYSVAMALLAAIPTAGASANRHPGIEAAKAWARQHAQDNPGVADLAAAAGLSRFHFSRLFQRSEGTSPAAWLTDLRLRQATRLLRDRDLSVAAIAERCGYVDPAYFCRVFRRTFGVSPGEFRTSGMY